MREERFKRYLEKIKKIQKRLGEIHKWSSDFLKKEKDKLAVYKAFQEISEAIMDIVAMMLKDEELIPKDDYQNIKKLKGQGIINEEVKEALIEVNGLRNRIVHEYNGLDHKIALDSMKSFKDPTKDFLKEVKRWLKKKS